MEDTPLTPGMPATSPRAQPIDADTGKPAGRPRSEWGLGVQPGGSTSVQIPTLGRIVLYKLSAEDVTQINRRRTTGASIAERLKVRVTSPETDAQGMYVSEGTLQSVTGWPAGAQAHIGNVAELGQVFPMTIVRVWESRTPDSAVNGQVHLDGNDVFWATNRMRGTNPGEWDWPPRV